MRKFIGGKALETPALIAGYRIKDYPRAGLHYHPWNVTGTQALLLNAFDLLANHRTKMFTQEVRARPGKLHEYVQFDGPLILDSGAFNFLQQEEIAISPIEVLNIGLTLGADASVVLDHPFPFNASPEEILARLRNTRVNTQAMVESLRTLNSRAPQGFQLIPVIHGHDEQTLTESLNDVCSALGQTPRIVGIGSLAPIAKNGNKRKAIDVILHVRRLLPDAHIHCFSMGSALLMLIAFYCGADTIDSQTWIMSAAFKQVHLPGFHLTELSRSRSAADPARYRQTKHVLARHLVRLTQQEGFTPRNWDTGNQWFLTGEQEALEYLDHLEDGDGINRVHARACHNLYASNFEAGRVRRELEHGTLAPFIEARVRDTVYRKTFEYAAARNA
jgi:queuine/archaeosine tRNA-ribosyltransferase